MLSEDYKTSGWSSVSAYERTVGQRTVIKLSRLVRKESALSASPHFFCGNFPAGLDVNEIWILKRWTGAPSRRQDNVCLVNDGVLWIQMQPSKLKNDTPNMFARRAKCAKIMSILSGKVSICEKWLRSITS